MATVLLVGPHRGWVESAGGDRRARVAHDGVSEFVLSACVAAEELVVESRLGEDTIRELSERGHDVVDAGPWALGRLSAVSRDHATGILKAAANSRGMQGYAVGR